MIEYFINEYSFLCNFYLTPIILDGVVYRSVEHAFQAQKTENPFWRNRIRDAVKPGTAKSLGRRSPLRPNWDRELKVPVMRQAIDSKFAEGSELARLLLLTDPEVLIEGNFHHDNIWGDCRCGERESCRATGQNLLGITLMERRAKLKALAGR